jgi:hypothetical protein
VRSAVAPLFEELGSDWLVLDCELLPWSAKARGLIEEQYAAVGTAALHALPALADVLAAASARGLEVDRLARRNEKRLVNARAFRDAYAAYVRPTDGLDGVTIAPFQVLAAEGRLLAVDEPHPWHLTRLGALSDPLLTPTRHVLVDLSSETDREAATRWWTDLTAAGGEGVVVKPAHAVGRGVQPGLKVRGPDYLRIIYGPDYRDAIEQLRDRNLGRKRSLAAREHALGVEALRRFVAAEPLWRVHEAVFGVLALESEPVDPRL